MPVRSTLAIAALLIAAVAGAQVSGSDPDGPWDFDTHTPGPCSATGAPHGGCPPGELVRIRVTTVVTGLVRPWHLAFLPSGDALVTELPGALRIVRNGKLEPAAVRGWPDPAIPARSLNSVALHPKFAENGLVYLSYVKARSAETTVAAARARFDGNALHDVAEIYEADAWGTGATAGRAEFGPDGKLYLTVGDRDAANMTDDNQFRMLAQKLDSDAGKVLRLNDDGSTPKDNPFAGRADANGAIYTYGHRNAQGLACHPSTGELWATEIGPMGGDELNVLKPGANYGWPARLPRPHLQRQPRLGAIVVAARHRDAGDVLDAGNQPERHDLHGRQVPAVAGPSVHRRVERPAATTLASRRLLVPLDARVSDVRQGPDGLIYVLVERDLQSGPGSAQLTPNGSLLRIEPAN